jgi:signal transduction histidine kinase
MYYICIILSLIILILLTRLFLLRKAMKSVIKQMKEIEGQPDQNRQLKTFYSFSLFEKLLQQINHLYSARQEQRIQYQRREEKIRQEIENISHDLRTPLTSILGYIDLVEDKETKDEESQEYLTIIRNRAKLLQSFIQDFYEISQLEADDYPLNYDVIYIQSLIKEAAVAYYHEFDRKEIQVEVNLENEPCHIIADKLQFNRILNNLVQNALKYTKHQFIIRQYTQDNCCYMQFINDADISEEELSHIFDRFFMGDHSRGNQSSGLGLTITKLLVEKMRGQIEARLEQGMFLIEMKWSCK